MKLSIGIVGLPNVGKSTLFNALLQKQVADVANYPFCTVEPNVGVVAVPDERLPSLANIAGSKKTSPAAIEFYDIAGLVKGASQGEGLGNRFLSHIREVSAIIHLVRLFDDSNVSHPNPVMDPGSDIETIKTELMLADLATLEKQKPPKGEKSRELQHTFEVLNRVRDGLERGKTAADLALAEEDKKAISHLHLLTLKPVLYVFNVSESQLGKKDGTETENSLRLCAKMENEIALFPPKEQRELLSEFGLSEPALERLIKKSYELLEVISFFTANANEARTWTIKRGTTAREAAGVVHSDFEKNFIRADVIPHSSFVEAMGWGSAREKGLVRTVGRDYEMKDGDVVEFKVGV